MTNLVPEKVELVAVADVLLVAVAVADVVVTDDGSSCGGAIGKGSVPRTSLFSDICLTVALLQSVVLQQATEQAPGKLHVALSLQLTTVT